MEVKGNQLMRLKLFAYRRGLILFKDVCYRRLHFIPPLPLIAIVELTNNCNAHCSMCDRQTMTRKAGFIDWDLYRAIIDQIVRFRIRRVNLNRFGEPLLHPKIVDMVRYAKTRGVKEVSFVSNGMLLDEKKAEGLIDAGLDKINISIDGATAETFERIRAGCKYDRVTGNLLRLLELRRQKGLKRPYVQINTLLMQDTLGELGRMIEEWRPRVDEIRLGGAVQYGNVDLNPLATREGLKREPIACSELFWKMIFFWNGDVSVCCEDIDGQLSVGNIREHTIPQLWKNEKYRELRRRHFRHDFSALPVCAACDLSNRNMVELYDSQVRTYSNKFKLYLNAP
jgi:radical SAM protein with 4Fe4S-binding SPASM domain